MKKILKITAATAATLIIIICSLYFFWLSPKYTVPIFTYHCFGYEDQSLFVTPENFDKQMRYLKNKGYNVISLDEFVEGMKKQKRFKHSTVVITIDDGYKDNFIYAYPILKKYGFPAMIFVASDYIGTRDNFMNWDQVKVMLKDGISFGGHSRSHAYLPSIKEKDVLWNEIAGCKEVIEKQTGRPVDYFCYPKGGFKEETKMFVEKARYKGACTTNRGFDAFNKTDVYEIHRIKITNSDMNIPFSFRAKLSGYYNIFRKTKPGD